jgi:hypothetical protein
VRGWDCTLSSPSTGEEQGEGDNRKHLLPRNLAVQGVRVIPLELALPTTAQTLKEHVAGDLFGASKDALPCHEKTRSIH